MTIFPSDQESASPAETLTGTQQRPAELCAVLTSNADLSAALADVASSCANLLSTESEVFIGITHRSETSNWVVASSSPAAAQMDEVQAGFDEGPCLESQRTQRVIRVPDSRRETRWPNYMNAVVDSGLRSVLAVPLFVDGQAQAAMNLYSKQTDFFDEHQIDRAQHYAGLAAQALAVALRITALSKEVADRKAAMESRTVIDVAKGIIMGQNRCSAEEAFAILERASSHRNIKLHAIAEDMVAAIGAPSPQTYYKP